MSLLSRVRIAEQHRRTTESWIEEINFYETEVGSCELSLEQFILALQKSEKLAAAEHFQNQFIRQREVINELKFKIRQYLRDLPAMEKEEHKVEYERHFSYLSEEVCTFRKLFNELLLEFDDFLKECDNC